MRIKLLIGATILTACGRAAMPDPEAPVCLNAGPQPSAAVEAKDAPFTSFGLFHAECSGAAAADCTLIFAEFLDDGIHGVSHELDVVRGTVAANQANYATLMQRAANSRGQPVTYWILPGREVMIASNILEMDALIYKQTWLTSELRRSFGFEAIVVSPSVR